MQVNNLIDYFSLLAATHNNIASFGTGDRWEVAIAGEDNYKQLWLEQVFNYRFDRGKVSWDIAFMVLDIQLRDESDENNKLDETHQIATEIIEKIKIDGIYTVSDDYSAVSFTEAFEDNLAGWRVEVTLCEVSPVDKCSIAAFLPPQGCNYTGFVNNLDGNTTLVEITTADGPLPLTVLPAEFDSLNGAGLAALASNIQAELQGLGYNAAVNYLEAPTKTLIIDIINSTDVFMCTIGDAVNRMFSAFCDCYFIGVASEATTGEFLNEIIVDGSPLALSSLPFLIRFGAPNFEADRLALENELNSLGYNATVVDTTLPGAKGRAVTITINDPQGQDFQELKGEQIVVNQFSYLCS